VSARPNCPTSLSHLIEFAWAFAADYDGNNLAAMIAMIPITSRSSMSVKPRWDAGAMRYELGRSHEDGIFRVLTLSSGRTLSNANGVGSNASEIGRPDGGGLF
jgi:hypothetical protein